MRRPLQIAAAVGVAIVASGCGGNPGPTRGGEPSTAERQARLELIRSHSGLNDLELATLCPALYPPDAISNAKKYSFEKQKVKYRPTASDVAAAAKAGCGQAQASARTAAK